jgi:hypothetical protein
MAEPVDPQEYARMRAIATELWPLGDHLEGFWGVEIGRAGPFVMMSPAGRHESIVYRVGRQLEEQIPRTHPGTDVIARSGAEIEDPSIGRMRRPDAVVLPLRVLEESEGTVDAGAVLAVVEVVSKNNPDHDYIDKVADYPAMGRPAQGRGLHLRGRAARPGRAALRPGQRLRLRRHGPVRAVADRHLRVPPVRALSRA